MSLICASRIMGHCLLLITLLKFKGGKGCSKLISVCIFFCSFCCGSGRGFFCELMGHVLPGTSCMCDGATVSAGLAQTLTVLRPSVVPSPDTCPGKQCKLLES